jgi:hypothetical protein
MKHHFAGMKKRLFKPKGTSKSIKRRTDNTTTTEKEINNGAQKTPQKIYSVITGGAKVITSKVLLSLLLTVTSVCVTDFIPRSRSPNID